MTYLTIKTVEHKGKISLKNFSLEKPLILFTLKFFFELSDINDTDHAYFILIKSVFNYSDFELQVKVQGPRPENVIFLIHEIFESLIKESFHGVVYEFLVPCPDCVLKEVNRILRNIFLDMWFQSSFSTVKLFF